MVGNEVLMVSGSDVHGTPITVRADAEGVTAQDIVDRYHGEFVRQWDEIGLQWDLYTTTGTDHHARVTQEMFLKQLEQGFIDKRTSEQFFDPEADRFLPDRYIEGTCPHCGYGEARGDQCDNCGRTLDATDLIDPRSKISGATPELRPTEHFYFRYSDFTERVGEFLADKQGWRNHVLNFVKSWINEEGLLDRAITRDLDWGVELPVDDLGPGKRIYVWYDAVIGYLSASQEWAQRQGDDQRWRHWWHNDDSRHVYFIGKDNIPFHCLFWPAQLMGYDPEIHLPDDVPADHRRELWGRLCNKFAVDFECLGYALPEGCRDAPVPAEPPPLVRLRSSLVPRVNFALLGLTQALRGGSSLSGRDGGARVNRRPRPRATRAP